jgi:hypothetical protein
MGYSKASSSTRGRNRWRAYINICGKQIVQTCRTEREAKKWSETMNARFAAEKRMPDGYTRVMQSLGRETSKEWIPVPCGFAEVSRKDGKRCEQFRSCDRYLECLDRVTKSGFGEVLQTRGGGIPALRV